MDQKTKNEFIKTSRVEFLHEMHKMGLTLEPEEIDLLKKHKLIDEKKIKGPKREKKIIHTDPRIKTKRAAEADKNIDIIYDSDVLDKEDSLTVDNELYKKITDTNDYIFEGGIEITKEDWMPASITEHEKDFVDWIDSINSGFRNIKPYKKFQLYVQQANDWFAENGSMSKVHTMSEKEDYALEEMRRSQENTLYFLNKYLKLKEGDMHSGVRTYDAKPVHEVIAYMFDCGYSTMIGKPRQIAATSTLGGCALKKIVFQRNFFLKFITQDKDTGVEIFEDKIKYPFGELPEWMKPAVSNDRDNLFRLSRKGKKGTKKGINSSLRVVAPSVSAINGGSPQVVMVDEAGYISVLGKMMKEARPTMFMQDPDTGKLIMKRQIIVWGTGGEMDKAGKAYEEEYMNTWDKWENREFEVGIVPLFFDWTTRPGITQEFYDQEKAAYTIDGPDKEERMVQFRQTYPSIKEDMFLTSAKTLLSIDWINRNLERIRNYPHNFRCQKGYFEPKYDYNSPADENQDVPYKVIGAEFVPTEDDDPRASAMIFMHPKKNWIHRYYSGTDPVANDNGYSNMATAVIDVYTGTVSAIVNYRDSNHKHTFLQCMLLPLYYGIEQNGRVNRCKELVEANIGTAYADYVDLKGFYDSLVYRTELPMPMQGGNSIIGIDNRGNRSKFIINMMFEYFSTYGGSCCIDTVFIQLRTFTCTVTQSGNETWGTSDKRKYHDDVLFAIVFAYICSLSYAEHTPKEIKSEQDRTKVVYETFRDKNGMLDRRIVRKKIA